MMRRLDESHGIAMADFARRHSRVHFVGIGGVGMSGIAEVLCTLGYDVSGSDTADNAVTHRLAGLGIAILSRHTLIHTAPGNLVELDVEGFPIPNRWYLVRWRTKNPSPAAQAFSRFAEIPLETPTLPD